MSDLLAPGYIVRHPEVADAADVHAVIMASDVEEFGESEGYSFEEFEGEWTQRDLGHDVWVGVAPGGEIAGYGMIEDRRHVRQDVEIYIHPAHFGKGIGTTLVRLAEARAREHLEHAPPGTRVVVNNWINALNPEARSLLKREGYSPVRYFFRMEITFSEEPPSTSWPAEFTVRSVNPDEDLRPFYETTQEAMADHWGHVAIST